MKYAPQLAIMSEKNIKRLQGIQKQALKIIYQERLDCSRKYLHEMSGISQVTGHLQV